MYKSLATIKSPEFINLQPVDINPLMSTCDIKVLYLGKNRNHSYITKEVATEMAKTLRGCPIVGYFKEEQQDFRDHGEQVVMDESGIHFNCLTTPYGFVAPDAKVWFQEFEDTDQFGNVTTREYLMTTGFLWTGQFPEIKEAVDEGRPQSMELDEKTCEGNWATDNNSGLEFFIINDAIFSKLCILGEDVEPCFEGSSIQTTFTKELDDKFTTTLFSMMQDLQFVLKGGPNMPNMDNIEQTVEVENQEITETEVPVEETPTEEIVEETPAEEPTVEEEPVVEEASVEEPAETPESTEFSLLQTQYQELQDKFDNLKKEYDELVEFKLQVEDKEKDALINSFYMLSDEDKADVIKNKRQYSYDDIEAKLSVICVRNKVNFTNDNEDKQDQVLTYSLNDDTDSVPAWLKAVQRTQSKQD